MDVILEGKNCMLFVRTRISRTLIFYSFFFSGDRGHSDSGIGSGQTDRSMGDPLSPPCLSPGSGQKRRSRGSDSSEDEWVTGRQRGRLMRTRQLSKVSPKKFLHAESSGCRLGSALSAFLTNLAQVITILLNCYSRATPSKDIGLNRKQCFGLCLFYAEKIV